MTTPLWRIELFGGLKAQQGERTLTHFETRKVSALLACLALRLDRAHSREVLAEMLWPEENWDATRNRLRQALSSLRRELEPPGIPESGVLLADRSEVRLNPVTVVTDVAEFEAALREELGATPSATTRSVYERLRTEADGPVSTSPVPPAPTLPRKLEPEGGAVPLDSPFYIVRPTDAEFEAAIARQDSIVLVKGARQMGKTSLLARGLQRARKAGVRVVMTDLQKLTAAQMESADALFLTLAETMVEQLELDIVPKTSWIAERGWNINFERFLRREVLGKDETPVVWGLDEVDRLFGTPFHTEVFGLFRSWHNGRSLNPDGPWGRLTLAMAYATEAHLFITDLNQSPFNVGTRLTLDDFTQGEVAELNRRYGSPLRTAAEVARCCHLLGGHPYLTRRALHALADQGLELTALEAQAEEEDGVFSDHLRRMLSSLRQDTALCDAVRDLLRGQPCPSDESFYRLQSAGILIGKSAREARFRCRLYQTYLEQHLL